MYSLNQEKQQAAAGDVSADDTAGTSEPEVAEQEYHAVEENVEDVEEAVEEADEDADFKDEEKK